MDIVVEGAEGDAVRGGEDEGGEAMRGGEGDVADAVRYGKGNKEVDDDAENRREVAGDASSNSEFTSDEDITESGDDFESEYENKEGDGKTVFTASEKYDPNFEIGMIFSSKSDFKDAVYGHAVKTRRSLKITKNDSRRIYARCDGEGCEWRINALKVIGETTFQIREYNSVHTCARSFNVKNMNSG
ncbi:UNVERIFIED_CONTAM: hypothetical protein Sradi_3172700 [Sesamum radiatum]|uniref:Transposase MuDR plant domain-containing protein n=1 Tax=Sesamum radiatum TaxID=300843 RepID=A0AAW2REH5_SESRA